jgi:hypothetical protein
MIDAAIYGVVTQNFVDIIGEARGRSRRRYVSLSHNLNDLWRTYNGLSKRERDPNESYCTRPLAPRTMLARRQAINEFLTTLCGLTMMTVSGDGGRRSYSAIMSRVTSWTGHRLMDYFLSKPARASLLVFAALLFSSQMLLAQFVQHGPKLIGTGALAGDPRSDSGASQGSSVALSADGSTAIVGGPSDDSFHGAVWVFTRSGGVWAQQGSKLIGTGAGVTAGKVGGALRGQSVALSADGNTAIVGGPYDHSLTGAA